MSQTIELHPTGPLVRWVIDDGAGGAHHTGRVMEWRNYINGPNLSPVIRWVCGDGFCDRRAFSGGGGFFFADDIRILIQPSCGGPPTFVPWRLCEKWETRAERAARLGKPVE